MIEKRPEVFKIECLQQIRRLFPKEFDCLHAGFGNKSSVSVLLALLDMGVACLKHSLVGVACVYLADCGVVSSPNDTPLWIILVW